MEYQPQLDHNHDHEYITVVDEEGNEVLYEILFTFESPDFNKSYVLIYPAGLAEEEDIELQAYSYVEADDGTTGALQAIETEEEWDMIDEVLNTFLADDDE
ncbi:DUF1292 domain-containing protein [Eremococcus coleocola]|uniref:UPF0473 protein HMPREF9257_1296 n=1 Tax=Eremococcus coleocola ACS-139-V-Col8 TaxID=908337 RepID=E4KP13_9LACT|nr:DUF1292 domain-containing protein [Eremococcus coleocola]EFR31003.1 hypothetical protein HMPREF9257_1296 [Eremococcus coleocola ACS-139-V-Col8]